ncbi:MAG: glycosyltransferase [Chloroflexota bacterium]
MSFGAEEESVAEMCYPKKRILMFSGTPLFRTALVRRASVLAREMARAGWEVTLSCVTPEFDPRADTIEHEGLVLRLLGQANFREDSFGHRKRIGAFQYLGESWRTASRLHRLLHSLNISTLCVFTTLPVSLLAILRCRKDVQRLYVDIDDLTSGQAEWRGLNTLGRHPIKWCERYVPRLAHKVTVCSDYLAQLYPGSIVIPNMVNLSDFSESKAFNEERPIRILFLGEVGPYHGHREVLQALARRKDQLGDTMVQIVGGGSHLADIEELSRQLGLERHVFFSGRLNYRDVLPYLHQATIGLLPLADAPVDRARFPLKLLEYLASYTVVVANPTTEVSRVIRSGENGVLTADNSADSLIEEALRLRENGSLLRSLATEGRKTAERYSVTSVMQRWLEVLEGNNE